MSGILSSAGHRGTSSTQCTVEAGEPKNKDSAAKKREILNWSSVLKGLILSFFAGVFNSLGAVIVKSMKNIHPGQLSVYRFVAVLVFSLPQAVKSQENLFGPRKLRFSVVLRGIFGATSNFLSYLAFRYLPLGEASVIIFSAPVFVTLAARIFLKESCRIVQFITVIMTVIGIMFIIRVPEALSGKSVSYSWEQIYGLVASFASLIFITGRYIVLRKLKSVDHSIVMFNFGWVAVLETSILTALVGDYSLPRCGLQQGLVIIIGIVSYISVDLGTVSIQLEQAGPVATMRCGSDIILAFLWQTVIFHNSPDVFSITGAVLVGISIVLVLLTKWVESLPSESSVAKNLKFLTV